MWRCLANHFLVGVENVGSATRAIDRRADRQADLVDEPGPQKGSVGFTAAFEQQTLDPELAIKNFERQCEIEV